MPKTSVLSPEEQIELDRFYREGGLRAMASPRVHYDDSSCPHPGCDQKLEWIDFKLELHGDPDGVYKPLVTAWWTGTSFAGRCPTCHGWIHFTTLRVQAIDDHQAATLPQLPPDWQTFAQIA
jgi:hypothetical protein